jgi:CHAT domain-containing protein
VKALLASERARARALLDSLLEEKISTDRHPSAKLLAQEQDLLRALDQKAEYQMRLLAGEHTNEEAEKLAQEIRALTMAYQDVRSQIRATNPRDATLTQPEKLQAEDIMGLVKNEDTVLIEFALGDEESYVWVVSAERIASYELPDRSTIERSARKVYELLTVRQTLRERSLPETEAKFREADADYLKQSALLSNMLLGQAADRLGSRRLLIVADGLLNYIPFAALPVPQPSPASTVVAESEPLLLRHQVVGLPSALTLIALRSEKIHAQGLSRTIAIVADPVFDKDDPRVNAIDGDRKEPATGTDENVYLSNVLRSLNDDPNSSVVGRLPFTLREAKAIMAVTPPGQGMIAAGFAATKDWVESEEMKDFRIIHFATHGLMNSEQPELSGIILSLVDENGRGRKGYLRLPDIYNLELSTGLVVLSACRTGLGKDFRGEGVVGLTSGFMYAGAKSVVASLWKVDDEATAELMRHFYTAMLRDGLPPAEALNTAKLELRKQERWRSPFFWAAFVLQGEYRADVRDSPGSMNMARWLLVGGGVATIVACVYLMIIRRRARGANRI